MFGFRGRGGGAESHKSKKTRLSPPSLGKPHLGHKAEGQPHGHCPGPQGLGFKPKEVGMDVLL